MDIETKKEIDGMLKPVEEVKPKEKVTLMEALQYYGYKPPAIVDTHLSQRSRVIGFEIMKRGCQIHVENEPYPMRVHALHSKVTVVSQIKRMIPLLFTNFRNGTVINKIISIIYFKYNWEVIVNWIHNGMLDIYMDVDRYSQPVRELYRIVKDEKIRDILCAILEYDTAYRYIVQDTVSGLNKDNFNKNPVKELTRLLKIARERNLSGSIRNFLKTFDYFLWYLYFNKKLLNKVKEMINEINIEEIKPSIEDVWWMNKPSGYNYFGKDNEQRTQDNDNMKRSLIKT